jgi:hypothetical protein
MDEAGVGNRDRCTHFSLLMQHFTRLGFLNLHIEAFPKYKNGFASCLIR